MRRVELRRVDQFVDSIDAGDPQPTLYFLHLLLPHTPWKYLPDGKVYSSSSLPSTVTAQDVWPTPVNQLNQQRHLVQLAYTDKVIARVLQRLKDQGLYHRSLVAMTADHGEGFAPGSSSRALGPGNAAELMWVPMLLKAPGQTRGRIDDRNWEHVDLLPTIADVAGLSIPWKVDGPAQTGQPLHRPGPPNFATVLHGVTDTLVRAHQHGERGFWQSGPRPTGSTSPRRVGPHRRPDGHRQGPRLGPVPGPRPRRGRGADPDPGRAHHPDPGPPQLQLYLTTTGGTGRQLQPVTIASPT